VNHSTGRDGASLARNRFLLIGYKNRNDTQVNISKFKSSTNADFRKTKFTQAIYFWRTVNRTGTSLRNKSARCNVVLFLKYKVYHQVFASPVIVAIFFHNCTIPAEGSNLFHSTK